MVTIDELKLQHRWVLWKLEERDGKQTKVPYQPGDYKAASDNPRTWRTFAEVEAVKHLGFSGVGVVLGEVDGVHVWGVDIDNCCDAATGKFTVESREYVIGLDSYSEFSPSGTGCHILGVGKLAGKAIKQAFPGCKAIELYDTERYLTFTGRHLTKTPAVLHERTEQLNALHARVVAAKPIKAGLTIAVSLSEEARLQKLLAGDMSDYGDDHSKADFALCCLLAKRHDCDAFAVEEAFNESGLARDKWHDREDYRRSTIKSAIKAVAREVPFTVDDPDEMGEDTPDEFLVENLEPGKDGWMPLGELSLIAGSSGAGKTSWAMPLLENIRQGNDVWGHKTTARDYRILLNDRSKGATRRTIRSLHLGDEAKRRVIRLTSAHEKMPPGEVMQAMIEANPGVEVWFVEGLDLWMPDANKMTVVSDVIGGIQRVATRYNVAVLATVGSPKQKAKDKFSGRDSIFGSAAFARKVETIVLVNWYDIEDQNGTRIVDVLLRTGKAERMYFQWGDRGLVKTDKPDDPKESEESAAFAKMYVNVRDTFAANEPISYIPSLGAKATFYRWRDHAREQGIVTRQAKQFYLSPTAMLSGVELSG